MISTWYFLCNLELEEVLQEGPVNKNVSKSSAGFMHVKFLGRCNAKVQKAYPFCHPRFVCTIPLFWHLSFCHPILESVVSVAFTLR